MRQVIHLEILPAEVKLRCEHMFFAKVNPVSSLPSRKSALRSAEIQTYDAYENMGNPFDVGFQVRTM